jgi:hypothetical protein
MMIFARIGFIAVAALVLATWGSHAQNAPQMGFQQVTLTKEMVKQFLSSYPQLQSLRKKYESNAPSGATAAPSYATSPAAQAELQNLLASSGFSDLSEWSKVAASFSLAYAFVKSGKNTDDMNAQTNSAIEKIQNNPKMPDAQKQQVIAMMRKQMGQFSPLPANVELVSSMMDEIKPVMETD